MATLEEWNDGIAWYFLDRPEAEGRKSRISLTEVRVREIAGYLGLDDSIDAVEDLVQSVFAEDSHDVYYDGAPRITKASKYADSFFYNARQLAYRYKDLRRSGLSGVLYPDFVPPFLAHMAICTLAMSDKSVNAAGNSVYPRVAKFLVDRIQVRNSQETEAKDVEKVKKALMKDYAYGGTGTFARTSYRIDTQGCR